MLLLSLLHGRTTCCLLYVAYSEQTTCRSAAVDGCLYSKHRVDMQGCQLSVVCRRQLVEVQVLSGVVCCSFATPAHTDRMTQQRRQSPSVHHLLSFCLLLCHLPILLGPRQRLSLSHQWLPVVVSRLMALAQPLYLVQPLSPSLVRCDECFGDLLSMNINIIPRSDNTRCKHARNIDTDIRLSLYLFIGPPFCSVLPLIRPAIRPSISHYIRTFINAPVRPSFRPSVPPFFPSFLSFINLPSVCLSAHLFL